MSKSTKALAASSMSLVAVYAIAHAAGLRGLVSFLSGTMPAAEEQLLLGLLYVLTWFGAVLVAPILVLGAALRFAVELTWARRRRRREARRSRPSAHPALRGVVELGS